MTAGTVNVLGVFDIFLIAHLAQPFMRDHFGKPYDRVKRRTEFVAHIGKEFRFRAASHYGLIRRDAEPLLALLPFQQRFTQQAGGILQMLHFA